MFGFIVGTLSLIGLVKVARWGRYGGGGWGRRGMRGGGWGRWMMRRLFERLDTTPGQEKVVLQAADEAQRVMWQAREEMYRARSEYAKAMRGEAFDNEALNAAFEKQQATVDELKKTLKERMQAIHEALNPQQRAVLADLIEFGPGRMHHGGHGRWGGGHGRWGGGHGRWGGGHFSHHGRGSEGPGPASVSV